MNKHDLIKGINKEKYDFSKPETSLDSSDYKEGYNDASDDILDIIKKLDEPQKVKVPEFVAEWFEENKHNLNFAIYELCEAGKVPVDLYEGLTYFERWFYLNHDIDTLIRMQDGYEIEEKPKFIVKQKDGFYIDGLAMIEGKTYAKTFESEAEAYKWAELCSGMIEKVWV
ncbi:DUF1642 domain-containing protein [Enterococcus avium]|uniref:DUF1642 domain-containing protein n=1 Tax=Enterococcus avium TaxID=33945 RepID=UPI0023301804|nr:DUF1642 domain-containing protein [Enterococcus avium]MDB1728592.1 DUF1642 domain-containing protein [Enterococcus avium]MDB1732711.1 DUF1642 domain-containing protein [Enterococcus avium]